MKRAKTKRVVLPYLIEVLNRSKYDGEPIKFTINAIDKDNAEIVFDKNIVGNYFHGRVVEAYNLKAEKDSDLHMPIVTASVAKNPKARAIVAKKYGTKSMLVPKGLHDIC